MLARLALVSAAGLALSLLAVLGPPAGAVDIPQAVGIGIFVVASVLLGLGLATLVDRAAPRR